ncbi:triosephosphate isomerase [Paramicrobacterium humi]|uniref:Triosephosphate isomerase n=1 Tax=Paramicrobacterium humi TaxID=640635 RepID=A0A1H4LJ07_9MICO|nr:triose-phosphate isomerase family protein [Microbacterium humi]SEB70674.1 triosephosphate isomerase [Microbacterium humi]
MSASPYVIGVSLKMYFSHARTVEWCRAVADIARSHTAIADGDAELFVIPSYLSVPAAREILGDLAAVGAQDLATEDSGAFTGEVSGAQIAEFGCRVVEVGHAERRRLFGETEEIVRQKTDAALRNGLAPVLCIGEADKQDPSDAAAECIRQLDDALSLAREAGHGGRVIVAYEPFWAIGASEPASPDYIRAVCSRLRDHVRSLTDFPRSAVIYGGSAGPGLLSTIGDDVDGLFLGRFSHDPAAVATILDEVHALSSADAARTAH